MLPCTDGLEVEPEGDIGVRWVQRALSTTVHRLRGGEAEAEAGIEPRAMSVSRLAVRG
jgi:hypothetical protein